MCIRDSVQTVLGGIFFVTSDLSTLAEIQWNIGLPALFYLGILGSFLANFLQAIAQKHTPATTTSLIVSSESVFTSVFSVLFGYDVLTQNLLIGGMLILASIAIAQLDHKNEAHTLACLLYTSRCV